MDGSAFVLTVTKESINVNQGYQILHDISADGLARLCDDKEDDGYVYVGGICVVQRDKQFHYFQAMAPPPLNIELIDIETPDEFELNV